MTKRCYQCEFFEEITGSQGGACHRFPPQMHLAMAQHPISGQQQLQPMATPTQVHANYWCGEWKEQEQKVRLAS